MLGSEILDVAIGIVFVFLLVSIIAAAIREGIEGFLKTRATHLEAGIRELLFDPEGSGLARQFFEHPLIFSLYGGPYAQRKSQKYWPISLTRGANLPSYIPSRNFALAVIDLAARGPVGASAEGATPGPITLQSLRENLSNVNCPPVQRALLTAIDNAQGDLQQAQANIEAWYDSAMDRVSGWYKRSTQWFLLVIGLALAVLLNVNAITLGNHLYHDKAARETLVARAQGATADPNYRSREYDEVKKDLDSLGLPIGGTDQVVNVKSSPYITLSGWIITAFAASLGAPFWFDLLNKIMVVRSTVKPHQKSPEESSDDAVKKSGASAVQQGRDTGPGSGPGSGAAPPPSTETADLMDGCDVPVLTATQDEDLPAAEGGIR